MLFRNLTIYRFPRSFADVLRESIAAPWDSSLDYQLAQCHANPCGSLEMRARGWVSPYGADSEAMFQQSGDCILLTLGGEDKILPPSAVKEALRKRVAELEANYGRRLSGKDRKRIKEDMIHEMLPRALVKPYRLSGYIDLENCFLAVDTSSRKAAEEFVSQLRHALGSFPAVPLSADVEPHLVLTGWVDGNPPPDLLSLGDECGLRDASGSGAVVKFRGVNVPSAEVSEHLRNWMVAHRLALTVGDRLSFVLGDDLTVRKLKFLEGALDTLDGDREDLRAELDARFALMAGEVGALFRTLDGAFRFHEVH